MTILFKNAIKRLRHQLRHQPTSAHYSITTRPLSLRLISLGVMTALGWAVFSSVALRPAPSLTSQTALQPISGDLVSDSAAVKNIPLDVPISANVLQAAGVKNFAELGASRNRMNSHSNPGASSAKSAQPFQLQAAQPAAKADEAAQLSGSSLRINGQTLPGRWQKKNGRIGVSSSTAATVLGLELMNTSNPAQQPVRWFPSSQDGAIALPAWWNATDRYLDISDWATRAGGSVQAAGNTLQISLPPAQVSGIRQGKQTWGDRIVVDLSGPTTWQIEESDSYTVTVAGSITPQMVRAFKAASSNLITRLDVAPLDGRTVLKISTKEGASPQIWSTGNPARVVIDIRRDAMVERDVAWAPGLRWRQQYVNVGAARFPVYMFITRPDPANVALRPIHAKDNSAIGIEPILAQAQRQRVTGAVNAGFFNRNNQLPLGAVRSAGQWISGPILGRGAMGWNDQGDLMMDRYVLSEVIRTESGSALPLLALNSGYVQAGISRYTAGWGSAYTPIVDNEIVVTVQDDRVASVRSLGKAGSGSVPIPANGYLLTLRSNRSVADKLTPGSLITLESQSQPSAFDQYPNVVGGGPLLIRDRSIVLNPQQEGFSANFIQGSAPRTAVGKTADGLWIVATIHDGVGGRGPTLSETAKIMQQLGAVDALNLDGGSSSSFYLGGQLLNRQPRTAARVNNGIGLFVLTGE
ncbi:MAG: phosphodiester glycosidase family protein [Phormidesmis sp.]